jgi:hypothetical protein
MQSGCERNFALVLSLFWEGDLLMEMEMGGGEQSVDGAVVECDNVV